MAVASATEPMACLVLAGGCFDRCDAAEAGECCFVAASAWVGPGDVERCCGDVADTGLGEELGSGLVDECLEEAVVVGDFSVEVLDASGKGTHRESGVTRIDRSLFAVAEAAAPFHEARGAQFAQVLAE